MVVIVVVMMVVVVIVPGHEGKIGGKTGLCRGGDSGSISPMGKGATQVVLVAAAAILPWRAGEARAANTAYAVDAADISETGSCKIESWLSSATNTDFSAVANPSCVVDPFKLKPVELSLLTNRSRSDGEWSTTLAPKAKINIVPTGIGKLGFA